MFLHTNKQLKYDFIYIIEADTVKKTAFLYQVLIVISLHRFAVTKKGIQFEIQHIQEKISKKKKYIYNV